MTRKRYKRHPRTGQRRNSRGQWMGLRPKVSAAPLPADADAALVGAVREDRLIRALARAAESGEPTAMQRFFDAKARLQRPQDTGPSGPDLGRLSVPQLRVLRSLLAIASGEVVDGRRLVHDLLSLAVEALTGQSGVAIHYRVSRIIEFLSGRRDVPSDAAPAVLVEPEPEPPPPVIPPEPRCEEPVAAATPVVPIDSAPARRDDLTTGLYFRRPRWEVPEY